MRYYLIMLLAALITASCSGQEKERKEETIQENNPIASETPKGSWQVNREFDEAGNLIRYDSIYSWSSTDDLGQLASFDRDSILKSLESRFYRNFSGFDFDREGFGHLFEEDSLFTRHFFSDEFFEDEFFKSEFGTDFMDIDKMHERMQAMQREFLERYRQPLLEKGGVKGSVRPQ